MDGQETGGISGSIPPRVVAVRGAHDLEPRGNDRIRLRFSGPCGAATARFQNGYESSLQFLVLEPTD